MTISGSEKTVDVLSHRLQLHPAWPPHRSRSVDRTLHFFILARFLIFAMTFSALQLNSGDDILGVDKLIIIMGDGIMRVDILRPGPVHAECAYACNLYDSDSDSLSAGPISSSSTSKCLIPRLERKLGLTNNSYV